MLFPRVYEKEKTLIDSKRPILVSAELDREKDHCQLIVSAIQAM